MSEPASPSKIGTARAVVLLCAFGLATMGAFTAFFATQILAAVLKSDTRPTIGMVIVCALVPICSAIAAVVLAIRARSTGKVIASGCGVLILGTMITAAFVLATAAS